MPSVVIFGTGFVGAPFTRALKKAEPTWSISVYTRSSKSDEELKNDLGADSIIRGSFDEVEKVAKASGEHDISVSMADSFGSGLATAIVSGYKASGKKGKVLHLSGSGNFLDFAGTGAYDPAGKIWSDDEESDIKQINDKMFNGPSDTVFLQAGEEGVIENYIVSFAVTYGGAAANAPGIGAGYNLFIPNAKSLGFVPYVGDGSAVVSTLHLLDGIDFLIKIMQKAASDPAEGSAYSRYYILETARLTWKEVADQLAKVLHQKGVLAASSAKSVDMEQSGAGPVKYLLASNMSVKGPRAERNGFQASRPTILECMEEDLAGVDL